MGRTIRRVLPNWEHPKDYRGDYIPKYDRSYRKAVEEWIENHQLWLDGKHPDQLDPENNKYKFYTEYGGECPQYERYMPEIDDLSNAWFQMYETVSEGTPVTPAFATEDELVQYLCDRGTFWDIRGWDKEKAEEFVKGTKSMPSGIFYLPLS